nr:site-specific integrase [uncultured Cohaesibacter sp.]
MSKAIVLHLKIAAKTNGERIFVAYDNDHKINPFVTGYLVVGLRGQPENTRQSVFDAIKHFLTVCEYAEIENPEYRLSYQTGLEDHELSAINNLLEIKLSELSKQLAKKNLGAHVLLPNEFFPTQYAGSITQSLRKSHVIAYMKWLMKQGDVCLDKHYIVHPDEKDLRKKRKLLIQQKIVVPRVRSSRSGSDYSANTLHKLNEFMKTYNPYDLWRNPVIAARNAAMFDFQYHGGLRMSEVLALKFENIIEAHGTTRNSIHVRDRHNDPEETRKVVPATKTGKGIVTIPNSSFAKYNHWLEVYQDEVIEFAEENGLSENLDHSFAFCVADARKRNIGAPLAIYSYMDAFKKLAWGAGVEGVGTHALRHLCAINYVRRMRAQNKPQAAIEKGMRDFFRWSLNSKMPTYYTTSEISQIMFDDMVKDLKKDNK